MIIPLQDGYIKLPEVEFLKFQNLNSTINEIDDNFNNPEFIPLDANSVIEGNEKIIRVFSINSCSLRINLI